LAKARTLAAVAREALQAGRNPLLERRAAGGKYLVSAQSAATFDWCAAQFISAHRSSWRNPKHAMQWENTIATYASPTIGSLPVDKVDTALVVGILQPIWGSKTETATRLRGRIETILDWAAVQKFRQGENPARWRGHLDHLFANPNKIAPVKNHPALPWQEISRFLKALELQKGVAARATEFLILTACRSGEVRGAQWSEISFTQKLWVIPAERMKGGREHRVPLTQTAEVFLQTIPRSGRLIFPGQKMGAALSDMSLSAVLRRMGRTGITIHGFRSTFRDWCAEAVGNSFPREVCEHALAHSLPDKVEAAYQRGDLLEKRRHLMEAWHAFLRA
jgi:integrase